MTAPGRFAKTELALEERSVDTIVAEVRTLLTQRIGRNAEQLTVCRGAFAKPDPGDPPHLAYVTTEARELARDPDSGADWVTGGNTIVAAMLALRDMVKPREKAGAP